MDEPYRALGAALLLGFARVATAQEDAQAAAEEVETIPVEPLREEEPDPGTVFPEEGPGGYSARVVASGGYDTNANSSTDVDRFFFFDLPQEQVSSSSPYYGAGGTLGYLVVLSERVGWHTQAGGEARWYPEAGFADNAYGTALSQLRFSGQRWRAGAGVVYTAAMIDERQANSALGGAVQLERLGEKWVTGAAFQHAQWTFEGLPDRDVDSSIFSLSLSPPPVVPSDWSPNFGVQWGWEEPKVEGSAFGRDLWGVDASLARPLFPNFGLDLAASVLRSEYDGRIGNGAEHRADTRYAASLGFRWRSGDDTRWDWLAAIRTIRNDSNELVFDSSRVVLSLEVAYGRQPKAE